jgi:hypothetical protein
LKQTVPKGPPVEIEPLLLPDADLGFLLGLLVGEGHFGGDGRQPHVTLRMHVRHEGTFRWLERSLPGSRLYGPYTHGGRAYFQWMVRGRYLREVLAPLIARHVRFLDAHVAERFADMCRRYQIDVPGLGPSARCDGPSAPQQEDGRVVGDVGDDRRPQPEPLPQGAEEQPQQQDVEVGGGRQAVAGVLEVKARPEE